MKAEDAVVGAEVVVICQDPLKGKLAKITDVATSFYWNGKPVPECALSIGDPNIYYSINILELATIFDYVAPEKTTYQKLPSCAECGIPNPYAEVRVGEKYTCRGCSLRKELFGG